VLLLHDANHGAPLIEALARHGDGLPARVIPAAMAGQFGLDAFATAFAFGAAEVRVLLGRRDQARREAVEREMALMAAILEPLGYGEGRLQLVVADDPFELAEELRRTPMRAGLCTSQYLPTGDKLALTTQALNALQQAAPTPVDAIPLPRGAPIGRVLVDTSGCTLCLACVSACPTSALRDNDERPMLKFVEDLCVQCGLCQTTCPEQVVSLEPRATFGPSRRDHVVLNEEAPAICIRCAKPFGVKSSIDRVAAQLEGRHWMFRDPAIMDRIRMCGDCRVVDQTRHNLDPYAGPQRPLTRTTEDYR
jgi:ferredoxin